MRFRGFIGRIVLILFLVGCVPVSRPSVGAAAAFVGLEPTPSLTVVQPPHMPLVSPTATLTLVPAPTAARRILTATVWEKDPQVPVLLYHRFIPLKATNESFTKMSLPHFRAQMQALYDAGFVLVPLADWLRGDLHVPSGKRPVILTMDDLFFADQIYLDADGNPSAHSALGVLWQFSQDHPDFGFSAALFYNLGDKHYGSKQVGDWFEEADGWQNSLARVIAWCIEHNAMPYNHFYTHPQLQLLEPRDAADQLRKNEAQLKSLLERIDQGGLAMRPQNLIALTYSVWPESRGSQMTIMKYRSLTGEYPLGVLEADPYFVPKLIMRAPYETTFTPWHIPRMVASQNSIAQLAQYAPNLPTARECSLTVAAAQPLEQAIQAAVQSGACPAGVYSLEGQLFRADGKTVSRVVLNRPEPRPH